MRRVILLQRPMESNNQKEYRKKQKLALKWKGPLRIIQKNTELYGIPCCNRKTFRCHVQRIRQYEPFMVENFEEVIDSDGSHMRTYEEDMFQAQTGNLVTINCMMFDPSVEVRTFNLNRGECNRFM